jgi:hypothetical protein
VYANRCDYRTGDSEILTVGAGIDVVPAVTAGLSIVGRRVAPDRFRGEDAGVGGARWVYVAPSVAWQVTESVSLDFGVRVVVYRDTETKLVDSNLVLQAGLTWSF